MNVEIKAVRGISDIDNERIVLKVLKDDDIGYYIIFDTTFLEDGYVSNKVQHSYWFPDKQVRAGDLVVLYTRNGRTKEKQNKSGNTTHFFFQRLEKTIWNKGGDCAVLVKIKDWEAKGYSK
jgi:hypothetical protein